MSLNHWKLGGQPTSYNPLPDSVYVESNIQNPLIVRFKAKSNSNAKLRIYRQPNSSYQQLTNVLNEYIVDVPYGDSNKIYLLDNTIENDIIIEDIQLVEKPLPKLTINGISGEVADWKQSTTFIALNGEIQVLPSTQYSISCTSGFTVGFDELANDGSKTWIVPSNSKTFTTKSNTKSLKPFLYKSDASTPSLDDLAKAKPMLNLGTIPAPYQKKIGERMVLPVAKKNLWHKPNSYSPLPSTPNGNVYIKPGKYWLSFKYFSPSNSVIRLWNHVGTVKYIYPTAGVFGEYNEEITIPEGSNSFIGIYDYNKTNDVIINDLQLEQGTIATPFEPYQVQLNLKPKRKVPKKNLIPSFRDSRWNKHANLTVVGDYEAVLNVTGVWHHNTFILPVNNGKTYTLTIETNGIIRVYKTTEMIPSTIVLTDSGGKFTVDSSYNGKITVSITNGEATSGQFIFKGLMLVEGSTATPFEPYQEVLPQAKTGLKMDGTQYVQLPSMTMDSIEIDCLIDSSESGSNFLIDTRTGVSNGYIYNNGTKTSFWESLEVNGVEVSNISKNERVKIIAKASSSFTDDVNVFASYIGSLRTKGILYGIKCYLAGQVVAEYDFTNPNNIVGDKLIQKAKNLIPSFDSGNWSLHSNFKVFGPNVGRLDATAGYQYSYIEFLVKANVNYFFGTQAKTSNARVVLGWKDSGGSVIRYDYASSVLTNTVKSPSNAVSALFQLDNGATTGSFDFIKPQLYELTGKEATLYGAPTPQLQAPKRLLYAKR